MHHDGFNHLIKPACHPAGAAAQLRERLEGWSAGQTVGDLFSPELTDMLKASPPGLAAAQPLLQP